MNIKYTILITLIACLSLIGMEKIENTDPGYRFMPLPAEFLANANIHNTPEEKLFLQNADLQSESIGEQKDDRFAPLSPAISDKEDSYEIDDMPISQMIKESDEKSDESRQFFLNEEEEQRFRQAQIERERDNNCANENEQSNKKKHPCQLCEKSYHQKSNLNTHYVAKHPQSEQSSGLKRTPASAKNITCQTCAKICRSKWDLSRHERTHTGQKPYVCEHCDKAFADSSNLRTHEIIHTEEQPHACQLCDSTFNRKTNLNTHYYLVHPDSEQAQQIKRTSYEKEDVTCSICNQTISYRNLQRHMQIHAAKYNFKCADCDQKFATADYLKRHKRVHTDEKPHGCELCDSAFNQKSNLNTHYFFVHPESEQGQKIKRNRK